MAKKVLIVDDSATVRQQVDAALTRAGFEVLEAVDGCEGIDRIQQHQDLAMVICDVNMPRKDGLEMLTELKTGGGRAELPILMLTTEGQPQLISRAKNAGARGWIVKPFKADMLVAAVKKLVGN